MKMTGSQIIPAPRALVWKGLNDPKILQQCIPGCQEVIASSPTDMKAKVTIKLGPVKATFAGSVKLSEINAPESCRISGKGEGGLAGFATGGASVKLTELGPNETQLDYDVDAQVGGKMAMLGSRLIDSTATALSGQFFDKFAALMKAEGASAAPALAKKVPTKKVPAKKATAKKIAVKKLAAKKTLAKKPAKKAVKKK
jgi:uncharacterized protein